MSNEYKMTLEEWDDLFTSNYHFLSKFTRADSFFTWLRQKRVLTERDEEEIASYKTTEEKSRHLIDMLKLKGTKGYEIYMEVLEWTYPELFYTITGQVAASPPAEFQQKEMEARSRKSTILINQLQSCMDIILCDNTSKKDNIKKLQETIDSLKQENDTMFAEIKQLQCRLERSADDAENLKNQNDVLVQKIKQLEDESNRKSVSLDKVNEMSKCNMQDSLNEFSKNLKKCRSSHVKPNCSNGHEISELCDNFKSLASYIQNVKAEMEEKQEENEKFKKEVTQLADLNDRLKADYNKALTAHDHQQQMLKSFKISFANEVENIAPLQTVDLGSFEKTTGRQRHGYLKHEPPRTKKEP